MPRDLSITFVAVAMVAIGCTGASTPTTTNPPTDTTTESTTTTTRPAATTTSSTTSTTTTLPEPNDGFIGLWELAEPDGHITRIDYAADGTFGAVNTGNVCAAIGVGDAASTAAGTYTLAAPSAAITTIIETGDLHCFPTDIGRLLIYDNFDTTTEYLPESDRLTNGMVRIEVTNPFVGTWSGQDVDGSIVSLTIRSSGVYDMTDTSSQTCNRLNLGAAPWSSHGWADFQLGPVPTAELTGTTICYDDQETPIVSNPITQDDWFWAYEAATDTIVFSADGATLSRVPNE